MQNHYEFLIIGGGPGGTPAAMALAAAGRSVLLVKKGPGGTCLFEGCIPSKIKHTRIDHEAARRRREFRQADAFGLKSPGQLQVDRPVPFIPIPPGASPARPGRADDLQKYRPAYI